jgi:hypothetical protein
MFTAKTKSARPITPTNNPNDNTSFGDNRPAGNGRLAVRAIRRSESRSNHWFSALHDAATSEMPNKP